MYAPLRAILLCLASLVAIGCSNWTGAPPAAAYTPAPGQYAPPAQPAPRVRTAIPPMAVDNPIGLAPDVDPQAAASDEAFALLDDSGRFDLIERQHLQSLLAEQHLAEIIQPGRLVHASPVRGFDYLLLGHITEMSVAREPPPSQASVAGVERALNIGQGWSPKLIANAKVDLSIVDVRTGAVIMVAKSEFHHTAPPKQFGLQLTSDQLLNTPDVRLNPVDTHRMLRLVLDEAIRPMLPRVDRWAATLPPGRDAVAGDSAPPADATQPHAAADASPAATRPAQRPSAGVLSATQICPECGARVSKDEEFCPNCGHKLR